MHLLNWSDVWYAHPGDIRSNFRKRGGCFFVGVWTGPQRDLICVRRADTNQAAERFLSPSGRTILDATIKAVWKKMTSYDMNWDARRRYDIIFNFFTGHK